MLFTLAFNSRACGWSCTRLRWCSVYPWSPPLELPIPKVLSNEFVTLKPISLAEAQDFFAIGRDEAIWNYLSQGPLTSLEVAHWWVASMLERSARSGDIPFSVYDNATGRLAGSSSYLDVRTAHSGLEIGFTWYGREFQRTHVNTATKLALFTNAFEELGAVRVQLQTDRRNTTSQRAIERLGAVQEGVLRKHKIYPNGYVRDSIMYSVIVDDWPAVKSRLLTRLQG